MYLICQRKNLVNFYFEGVFDLVASELKSFHFFLDLTLLLMMEKKYSMSNKGITFSLESEIFYAGKALEGEGIFVAVNHILAKTHFFISLFGFCKN